jgi:HPt (histidine-containing phosphotransfer) domain-containing protein
MTPAPDGLSLDGNVSASRQPAESAYSDVLDIERLRNRCMGNIDLLQRVLDQFSKRLPEELAELERALELSDSEQVARIAHRIKGTSANVSAERLQHAAAEIESLSRMGCVTDVPPRLDRLRHEWERYLDHTTTLFSALDQ